MNIAKLNLIIGLFYSPRIGIWDTAYYNVIFTPQSIHEIR